jgi:hypothetical protein
MRFSANNFRALLATGALIVPTNAIYPEIVSVTPHTACSAVASIEVAKPIIDRPEAAPISVARTEIASIEVPGKEKTEPDTSKQETVAETPRNSCHVHCRLQ